MRKRALLTTRWRRGWRWGAVQPMNWSRGAIFQAAAPKPGRGQTFFRAKGAPGHPRLGGEHTDTRELLVAEIPTAVYNRRGFPCRPSSRAVRGLRRVAREYGFGRLAHHHVFAQVMPTSRKTSYFLNIPKLSPQKTIALSQFCASSCRRKRPMLVSLPRRSGSSAACRWSLKAVTRAMQGNTSQA